MEKEKLIRMAKNPALIAGIYNYCDRWCERCAFTSHCLTFLTEEEKKKESGYSQGSDELNEEFWKGIRDNFSLVMEMVRDFAEKEGIDLEATMESEEVEAAMARSKKRSESANAHHCSKAAVNYYKLVNDWFEGVGELWEEMKEDLVSAFRLELPGRDPEKELIKLNDIMDVIRWYQHFISVKIHRALSGRAEDREEWPDDDMPSDADGSAKIALIAIDRSIGAWAALNKEFPEQQDKTLNILVLLDRLRKSLECEFPGARAFIRAGFDEEPGASG